MGDGLKKIESGLVSVIIPTWNRAKELPEAIRSALAQSHGQLEVLVCDDGSSDSSQEVVAAVGDTRVRWIAGPRAGLPAAPRNRGLDHARGEWIAFMDSDDCWLPDKLTMQLDRLQRSGGTLLASCGNALRRYRQADQLQNGLLLEGRTVDTVLTLEQLLQDNQVITSTVLLHHSLLERIGKFPVQTGLKVGEDYAYWLRVASLTPLAFHGTALASYTDDPATSVRAHSRNEILVKLRIYRDYFGWLAGYAPRRLIRVLPLCVLLAIRNATMRQWWRMRARLGTLKRTLLRNNGQDT